MVKFSVYFNRHVFVMAIKIQPSEASDCANAESDLNLRCAHMFEGSFSTLQPAYLILALLSYHTNCSFKLSHKLFHIRMCLKICLRTWNTFVNPRA